jgi:Lanthionine-containing peptide SapB precursor RamS
MALLDIQAMDPARDGNDARCGGSNLSVALCDSTASVLLCL